MEKATCPIDQACARELEFTQDCEKAVRDQVPEEKPKDYSLTEDDLTCDICGEPNSIPPARAIRGYTSCVSCKSHLERQSKLYNRRASRSYDYDD